MAISCQTAWFSGQSTECRHFIRADSHRQAGVCGSTSTVSVNAVHFDTVLQHDRVILRTIEAADIPNWASYLTMPIVYEHTSCNVVSSADLEDYASNQQERSPSSLLRLAIELRLRQTNQVVGTAGCHFFSSANRSAELAYDLTPNTWGRAIATAVVGALTEWAHSEAGVVRVQATTLDSNWRSTKVLERCGYEREGLLHCFPFVRGRPGDFWMYSHVKPPINDLYHFVRTDNQRQGRVCGST
jgi:ribosomal-protein-alanine N-acetyltransferase